MKPLYGTDISNYQPGKPDLSGWDFAYILATQGNRFVNPKLEEQSSYVEKKLKHRGYYHYLDNQGTVAQQAIHFVNTIGIKECQDPNVELWLDFEEEYLTGNEPKQFFKIVKDMTGKDMGIYMMASMATSPKYDWSDLPATTPLWLATYISDTRVGNNLTKSELDWGLAQFAKVPHFKYVHVWQYSGAGGYDWDIRYMPFPNDKPAKPKPKPKPEPKRGDIIVTKKSGQLQNAKGNGKLTPEAKANNILVDKGTKVTYIRSVGDSYEVEFYGLGINGSKSIFLHKSQF